MLLRIDGPLNFFWQWDLNRRILIEDQTCTQVHFTNGATQQALVLEIQRDDTGRYANVPNILLQQAKPITALLYLQNGESMTLHAQTFRILPRPRPDNYVYTETEVLTWVALDARIKALEESGGVSPEKVAEMVADYLDKNPPVESDPTVPAWAKQPVKPGYTAAEVGADPQGAASTAVSEHNVAADAHNDIRLQIGYLSQLQTTDKSSLVAAINELYATGGGSGGSSGGVTPSTAHTITQTLTNVVSSNISASVLEGNSFVTVLSAETGYTLGTPIITMGGVDITATAWNADTATITIASVTGAVVITCAGVGTETGTVTLAETADFVSGGFLRPTGVYSENASYNTTDYIDITGCTSITLNANVKTKSCSPAVWYDAEKNYISGETVDTSAFDVTILNAYTYEVPDGAVYVRSSCATNTNPATLTAERVGASSTPDEPFEPAVSDEANKVYISVDGNDENTGLSADDPIATFARAKAVGGENGTLVWMSGDYWCPDGVNLGAFAKMRTDGTVRLIYYSHKFDSANLVDGYTRVYSVPCDTAITGSIWQHDVADSRTEIAFEDRHPLHRDRTHRLPSTRIVSVTGVDITSTDTAGYLGTMEAATDNYLYYYDADAGVLYFTAPDADYSAHPIIKGSSTIIKGSARDVHIRGLNILYAQISVGALFGVIEDVSVLGGYGGGCIIWDGASGLSLIRCEAMGADNDGINGHATGHITCRDCWGHDNLDDGESCHNSCFITQYGGLYEHNGSGCTPATGGEGMYYGTIARNNGYTGFSAQGVDAVIMCNGCLATANNIGFNVGGTATGTLINCVAGGNTTNFNGGKRYNCVAADEPA